MGIFIPGFGQTPITYGSNEQAGKYIDINDIKIYYEK